MRKYALYGAWVVALIGFVMSLYYGEVLRYEPCALCWYQRTMLFPLAILLGIAAYREDRNFCMYGIVLGVLGGIVAIYQWLELRFPALRAPALCGQSKSCVEDVIELFGIAFPAVSAIGFVLIVILLSLALTKSDS